MKECKNKMINQSNYHYGKGNITKNLLRSFYKDRSALVIYNHLLAQKLKLKVRLVWVSVHL